ncbi:MAG: nucleotidyltransferase [Actinomyces sp.]|nr:MAG: nucleotidyltransferase [Actinomyces sp.]
MSPTVDRAPAPPTSLVVMAAGLGSRFGGTKQLAEVGPAGEAFCDFAIADAVAAGIDRVVMVVRTDILDDVRRHVDARHPDVDVRYVCQDAHGPRRAKPWGTGHAVLVAAPEVPGPFLVCNADDFYGRRTFELLADGLGDLADDRARLAGFRLDHTLPASGEVSRGVCRVVDGRLTGLVEHHGIGRRADGSITATDPPAELPGDTVVSMNVWAFPRVVFDHLGEGFERFLADHGDDPGVEYLLPSVVDTLRVRGVLEVEVVPTSATWVGVTNPDDLDVARERIAELVGR